MQITYTKDIADKDIANLMDSAGRGSRYWCQGAERLEYETMTTGLLNGSRALKLKDVEADTPQTYALNLKTIQKGLQLMADKWPKHWADFINEDGDDITGDVFLQLALLGDIIYG